jgi:ankyrin repeat protein
MNLGLILTFIHPPGKSALHWAAAVNNVEATLALLKNGANKDMQDSKVSPGPQLIWGPQSPQVAESRMEKKKKLVGTFTLPATIF